MKDNSIQVLGILVPAVANQFDSIREGISQKMEAAKNLVRNAIEKIKEFFHFEWRLPELKLPHIVVGEYIEVPVLGTIPNPATLHVDWYKKAMEVPRILRGASIFGYNPRSGHLLGGGESGDEVIVGKDTLLELIKKAVESVQQAERIVVNPSIQQALQPTEIHVTYGDVHMTVYGAEGQDVTELADIVSDRLKKEYDRERAVWK